MHSPKCESPDSSEPENRKHVTIAYMKNFNLIDKTEKKFSLADYINRGENPSRFGLD